MVSLTGIMNKPDDYFLFPFWFIFYMLGLHFAGKVIGSAMSFVQPKRWGSTAYSKRTNVVTYVLELIMTSVLLFVTLINGGSLLVKDHPDTTEAQLKVLQFCLVALSGLYLFELIYRPETNLPLAIHHVITIVMCALMVQIFIDHARVAEGLVQVDGQLVITSSLELSQVLLDVMRVAITISFHAITEQATFIGRSLREIPRQVNHCYHGDPQASACMLMLCALL